MQEEREGESGEARQRGGGGQPAVFANERGSLGSESAPWGRFLRDCLLCHNGAAGIWDSLSNSCPGRLVGTGRRPGWSHQFDLAFGSMRAASSCERRFIAVQVRGVAG